MANVITVARPYAKAILTLAKNQNTYEQWTNMLQFLAGIASDVHGYKVLSNLALLPQQKVEFILDVGKGILNAQAENLVKVLARAKRLLILPALFNLYEQMRKKAQGVVQIDLAVAEQIDRVAFDTIVAICNKSFTGTVTLSETVDANLISGGVAQIGNRVIDASVAGRLTAMRNMLKK